MIGFILLMLGSLALAGCWLLLGAVLLGVVPLVSRVYQWLKNNWN